MNYFQISTQICSSDFGSQFARKRPIFISASFPMFDNICPNYEESRILENYFIPQSGLLDSSGLVTTQQGFRAQIPHVGVVWKFEEGDASSNVILCI
ncbi:hypothetical protein TNCV_3186141 [Trichonephila clavipes]|nr:hypothetical protein TNCV_3186141 [Trichonephila clavipes]